MGSNYLLRKAAGLSCCARN